MKTQKPDLLKGIVDRVMEWVRDDLKRTAETIGRERSASEYSFVVTPVKNCGAPPFTAGHPDTSIPQRVETEYPSKAQRKRGDKGPVQGARQPPRSERAAVAFRQKAAVCPAADHKRLTF